MDIYTPIEEAGDLIRQRWADKGLRDAVYERLGGDIPEILEDGPSGLIARHVCTPDGEFKRFLDLARQANVRPTGFEYVQDKFHAANFTKYQLANLAFFNYQDKNGRILVKKEPIIDFDSAETKKLSELRTVWGEEFVDFHHAFLRNVFPETAGRIFDISLWIERNGGQPKDYYSNLLTFAICHSIYFDDFDLLSSEANFVHEVVLPAIGILNEELGVRPIIVKLSDVGEHEKEPYWWCYSKEARVVFDEHVKALKT